MVGGGVGEQGVAAGCPSGSGVGEGADDEGGFVVGVVGGADGSVFGSGVVAAPVDDAGLAEVAEADGVAAGFGEEVAAEAEHVGPAAQAGVVGVVAEAPAGGDEPFGVGAFGVGVQVDGVGGEAGGGVPGGLGAFGGVFGEVAGDGQVGDGAGAAHGDDPDVGFGAPGDEPAAGLGGVRRGAVADGVGGPVRGVLEVGGGDAGRRGEELGGVGGVVAVEAEQDVEVDCAAGLVFGGFAVRDADAVGQVAAAGGLVEVAFDGLLGAPPQFSGVVVPHDVGVVVVAVRAQRLAEAGVVAVVAGEAVGGPAVGAGGQVAAGVAGLGPGRCSGSGRCRCAGGPGGCGRGRRRGR